MAVTRQQKNGDPVTLVDKAYERIKADFARGALAPGEKIIFRDLVERYGISETPIKQALNRMVTEGLVESIPHKGMWVATLNVRDFCEVLDIRYALESFLAPTVLQAVSYHPEYLQQLEDNIKRHYAAIERGTKNIDDFIEIYNVDHAFHILFIGFANHKHALKVYESIGAHSFSLFLYNRKPKAKLLDGVAEHQAILDALKAQDLDALQQAIRVHMENAKASVNFMLVPPAP